MLSHTVDLVADNGDRAYGTVQDFVRRNFKYLNDNELQVMVDDINFAERINQLGDERIDKPDWLKFRERINSELEKRKDEQNA